jgi:hypothetical protein
MSVDLVIALVVAATSIWVAIDASHLGVKRGCLPRNFFDMGVVGWFFCVLLLWIIGFPAYLIVRPRYVALRRADAASAGGFAFPPPPPVPSAPPAGWYPDPMVPGNVRWWDGTAWGPTAEPQRHGG